MVARSPEFFVCSKKFAKRTEPSWQYTYFRFEPNYLQSTKKQGSLAKECFRN